MRKGNIFQLVKEYSIGRIIEQTDFFAGVIYIKALFLKQNVIFEPTYQKLVHN